MEYFLYYQGKLKPEADVTAIREMPNVTVLDDSWPTALLVDVWSDVQEFLRHSRTMRGWVTSPYIRIDLTGQS